MKIFAVNKKTNETHEIIPPKSFSFDTPIRMGHDRRPLAVEHLKPGQTVLRYGPDTVGTRKFPSRSRAKKFVKDHCPRGVIGLYTAGRSERSVENE